MVLRRKGSIYIPNERENEMRVTNNERVCNLTFAQQHIVLLREGQ